MGECKFLAFADFHYQPSVFMNDAKNLDVILQRAKDENVSFMMQLGDFVHGLEDNRWLTGVYLGSPIPAYSAIGNHCTDEVPSEEIVKLYKMPHEFYHFDRDGYRFLVLDPNYYIFDGETEPVHFAPGQARWDGRCWLTKEQLTWMKQTISESPYPCVIFSHQSLERTDGIINRDEAWEIINAANRQKENSVILCVNGHYHDNYCTFVNDVCCLDLNSSTYHWCDVRNYHYPQEMYDTYKLSTNCLYYDTPLSAVITLNGTDSITVKGCKGNYLYPTDEEELKRIDNRRLSLTRINVPYIGDYDIDLKKHTVTKK